MACETLNAYLEKESGRLTMDIARKGRESNTWNAVLEKDFWPDGVGHQISRVVYQRTIPTDDGGWTPITGSTGGSYAGNDASCSPTPAVLSSRATTESASLEEYVLVSDEICLTDGRASYLIKQQIREVERNYRKAIVDIWAERHRNAFYEAVPNANKLIFAGNDLIPGGTGGSFTDGFAETAPDQAIHQDVMDELHDRLTLDGAGEEGAYGRDGGQPIYLAMLSKGQQRALIKGDAAVRQDYRDAEPKELLRPFGVKRSYSGFFHMAELKPRRFDLDGGAWVERPYYVENDDGVAILNPDYVTALYEDVVIYHPKVVKCLMQKPMTSIGGMTRFKAWDYSGQIQWQNEYDKECNRFRDKGNWAARMRAAYLPEVPEYGYIVRVLRTIGNYGATS
jgi:hypothetical protein